MLVHDVVLEAQHALSRNHDLIDRLVAERKRFENWLHLEIFKSVLNERSSVECECICGWIQNYFPSIPIDQDLCVQRYSGG